MKKKMTALMLALCLCLGSACALAFKSPVLLVNAGNPLPRDYQG